MDLYSHSYIVSTESHDTRSIVGLLFTLMSVLIAVVQRCETRPHASNHNVERISSGIRYIIYRMQTINKSYAKF